MFSADEASDLSARVFVELRSLLAEGMDSAMNIGVGGFVVVNQRLYDLTWFLGRGGVVQIDQRLAIDLPG
jgi:hypothetical protein